MLRHTFLKRVAEKHGVHVAQDMSGIMELLPLTGGKKMGRFNESIKFDYMSQKGNCSRQCRS
jgi:hypothetical protein